MSRAGRWAGLLVLVASAAGAAEPIRYELSFPEPEQRWMQVSVTFPELPEGPLDVRMSRSSPGRYALHEFAKNVTAVEASDGAGRPLELERPDRHGWRVAGHDGTVRFQYRVYGDRVDGTYLGIDSTHAHINIPAALVWARGLESRPAQVRFEPPEGSGWRAATQLFPGPGPRELLAPNRAYLMDSPIELSDHLLAEFSLPARVPVAGAAPATERRFRIALHHRGAPEELDEMVRAARRIAREERAIYGELPEFDGGVYTFLADYLPWASGDGMEHRNSTVLTSSLSLGDAEERRRLQGTMTHELFHAWNVERIRPASLEPFDFEDANVSGDLWLAEGFTRYYGQLVMQRAGLAELEHTLQAFGDGIDTVVNSPARELRSPIDMSRLAPFVDAAASIDRTEWPNSYISYYTWGGAVALGLDLSLRARSDGAVGLDDVMRALWERHGRGAPPAPGGVVRPYTLDDVRRVLAEVSGDAEFARDFLARFVEGREVPDYAALLDRAGLVLRRRHPARAWLGALELEVSGETARVTAPVPRGSPAQRAGLAQDDVLVTVDGEAPGSAGELSRRLARHAPGDVVALGFLRRGRLVEASATLGGDPSLELVALESTPAGAVDPDRLRFRDAWLGPRAVHGDTAGGTDARETP